MGGTKKKRVRDGGGGGQKTWVGQASNAHMASAAACAVAVAVTDARHGLTKAACFMSDHAGKVGERSPVPDPQPGHQAPPIAAVRFQVRQALVIVSRQQHAGSIWNIAMPVRHGGLIEDGQLNVRLKGLESDVVVGECAVLGVRWRLDIMRCRACHASLKCS